MKTLLFLDANDTLKDSIFYAKQCGYRIITCDNIPTHVCHQLADVSYDISTYDIDSLKKIVEKEGINGVVYFASAHGLYGASRLIEMYNFPGIPFSVENLFSNKKKFREFLYNNNFDCPSFQTVSSIEEVDVSKITYPVIVKPIDSSGGNIGITKVLNGKDLYKAVQLALDSSFSNVALIESFIDSEVQINGDCLIYNGELMLAYLGKYIYRRYSILPYATIFSPTLFPNGILADVKAAIQRLISLSHIKSAVINVELRIGTDGKIYFIEVNPRHSGNQIYRLMNIAYDVNMSEIAVKLALGENINVSSSLQPKGNYAYAILYSSQEGVLKDLEISPSLLDSSIQISRFVKRGSVVKSFLHLQDRLALTHLSFNTKERMEYVVAHLDEYYKVVLE